MKTIYNAGDMLYKGSQLLREQEKQILEREGFNVYNPQDDKEINDKVNQTVESNNGLAEKIVLKDTLAIKKSDTIIIEPQRFAEGTLVELGQIKAYNEINREVSEILDYKCSDEEKVKFIKDYFTSKLPYKKVYAHMEDARRTDIPEAGDRRSFYCNQYVYGVVLEVTDGKGFMEFDEIVEDLKRN